jgi:hypothetical protein
MPTKLWVAQTSVVRSKLSAKSGRNKLRMFHVKRLRTETREHDE